MLSYEIICKSTAPVTNKPGRAKKILPGDPGYQQYVFNRVFASCNIHEGDYVKVRGTNRKGQVMKVHNDVKEIKWDNNRPLILQVQIDGELFAAHPGQLKRIRSL